MKAAKQTWTIGTESAGDRLDVFLTAQLLEVTRSALKKTILNKAVRVNGEVASVHRFLKEGDVIEYTPEEKKEIINPFDKRIKNVERNTKDLPDVSQFIIEETPDWIVLDKPAGLLIHPDAQEQEVTLVDMLLKHVPSMAKVGEDPQRPGIVHRLDREVSGLMVVAKTQAAFDSLKSQFSGRTVKKTYIAMVHGLLPASEGDIKFRIARSSSQPRMAARPVNEEEGKAAWTHYRVKETFKGASVVLLDILSGRTHQIRAHLQAMQTPVMGDDMYSIGRTQRNVKAPRLMLQSIGLEFNDPASGERKEFELAPVPEFEKMSEEFRKS